MNHNVAADKFRLRKMEIKEREIRDF